MESKEQVEMIERVIEQLTGEGDHHHHQTEKKKKKKKSQVSPPAAGNSSVDGEDNQFLSQLQKTMEKDREVEQDETPSHLKKLPCATTVQAESEITDDSSGGDHNGGHDEIVKELKKVQRQNFITHCLLSAMIVLTVTWQLSEVSLILKLKDGFNNPFRAVGCLLKGMIKPSSPKSIIPRKGENQPSSQILAPIQEHIDSTSSLSSLKIPEIPSLDLGLNIEDK